MDKLSELLQEARPLYFEQKKRKENIKKSLFVILPILFLTMAIVPFTYNSNIEETDYYTSSTSIVEQMGFPTDDYGLLKAD